MYKLVESKASSCAPLAISISIKASRDFGEVRKTNIEFLKATEVNPLRTNLLHFSPFRDCNQLLSCELILTTEQRISSTNDIVSQANSKKRRN